MSKKIVIKPNKRSENKNPLAILSARGSPVCLQKSICVNFLYSFVYRSSFSLAVVFLLLLSFVLQGVDRVYANEVASEIPVVEKEASAVPVAEVVESVKVESISTPPAEVATKTEPETVEKTPVAEVDTSSVIQKETAKITAATNTIVSASEILPVATTTKVLVSTSTEEVVVKETGSSGSASTESSSASSTVGLVSTTTIVVNDSVTENITPPTESVEQVLNNETNLAELLENEFSGAEEFATSDQVISTNANDTVFTFTKDQCTKLATGSFYCLEIDPNFLQDALFSAPDEDGDLEIFLVRDGAQAQVTNNKVDDAAPYFDTNSNTIVWHRLVNDRYQIVSYDINSKIETQLTNTAENNMEPTRQGKYTVWQRWVNNGWNIILNDGRNESQLTSTANSNIAPYVHGSLVVWNKNTQTGEKNIEMYDIETKTYVTVEDPDGMSVSNPRMVFVYDSLHPNGDVVTKGYDVLSKKFINFDTLPRELPKDIPVSESTGETRAMIQLKPTVKSDGAESVNNASSTEPQNPPPPPDLAIAPASEDLLTLDLSSATTSSSSASTEVLMAEEPSYDEISEYDMVIEPLTQATSTEGGSTAVQES